MNVDKGLNCAFVFVKNGVNILISQSFSNLYSYSEFSFSSSSSSLLYFDPMGDSPSFVLAFCTLAKKTLQKHSLTTDFFSVMLMYRRNHLRKMDRKLLKIWLKNSK